MKEKSKLIGKHLLIGITVLDEKDKHYKYIQVHGEITRVTDKAVVIFRKDTKTEFQIPPALDNIFPAEPGEYHLQKTNEVVVNPDFTSAWTIYSSNIVDIQRFYNFGFDLN